MLLTAATKITVKLLKFPKKSRVLLREKSMFREKERLSGVGLTISLSRVLLSLRGGKGGGGGGRR